MGTKITNLTLNDTLVPFKNYNDLVQHGIKIYVRHRQMNFET